MVVCVGSAFELHCVVWRSDSVLDVNDRGGGSIHSVARSESMADGEARAKKNSISFTGRA